MYGREELAELIRTKWAGRSLHYFDELGSTNVQADLEAGNGVQEGTLVVADMQTAGLGRRGRSWHSPAGTNIYFTLILRPSCMPDQASGITLVMALAVAEAIGESCGVRAQIKWPNDVVVNGKKVCGILTQMNVDGGAIRHVVVGVGVNAGEQDFPPEIAATATSLQVESGRKLSRASLVAAIMRFFEEAYESFMRDGGLAPVRERYESLLVNRGRAVIVLDPKGEYKGIARGINERGELLVEREDGSISNVYAGEVSVRGVYGYT